MQMFIRGYDVEVVSDLKDYGVRDDGTSFIGEIFTVQITNRTGARWVLNQRFDGVKVEVDDEYLENHFLDIRPQARAVCESLVRRIKDRGKIDLEFWTEGRPTYGSEEYIHGNWSEFDAQMERLEG